MFFSNDIERQEFPFRENLHLLHTQGSSRVNKACGKVIFAVEQRGVPKVIIASVIFHTSLCLGIFILDFTGEGGYLVIHFISFPLLQKYLRISIHKFPMH